MRGQTPASLSMHSNRVDKHSWAIVVLPQGGYTQEGQQRQVGCTWLQDVEQFQRHPLMEPIAAHDSRMVFRPLQAHSSACPAVIA